MVSNTHGNPENLSLNFSYWKVEILEFCQNFARCHLNYMVLWRLVRLI